MAQVQRKTNWFAIWISAAVVVALVAIGGIVLWVNAASSSPGTAPQASNINAETGAIAIGSGPDTLDTYVDFICPVCKSFEQAYGADIESWVEDGSITLNVHPISILNRASNGTQYSTRAANAMYCVAEADPDAALPFLQALFAQQPEEGSNGLTDEQLIGVAESVGVTGAADCITSGKYSRFVDVISKKTPIQPGQDGIATPTIATDGTVISNSDLTGRPADLLARLQS